jgi:VanZ family protein
MPRPTTPIQPKFAFITAVVAAAIVYGSLYPFAFYHHAGDPLRALLGTWNIFSSRGDLIANVLMYLPFGFFAIQSTRHMSSVLRVGLVLFAGMMFSTALELTQYYDRGRDSAMSDIYANAAGTLIGALAGASITRAVRLPAIANVQRRPFVLLLLACWLGYRLFPFAPVIDLHKYWGAVKPLIFAPKLPFLDLYRHFAIWLVIALLLEALLDTAYHRLKPVPPNHRLKPVLPNHRLTAVIPSRLATALLACGVLAARILIDGIVLSPAEVAGSLLAAVVWAVVLFRIRIRAIVVAALLVTLVVVHGLEPFRFLAEARRFSWMPLRSLMEGSLEFNILSFLYKVFNYGALVWVAMRAGLRWSAATLAAGSLVLGLSVCQVYLPGRSAEITDLVILLLVAATMKLMGEDPAARAESE